MVLSSASLRLRALATAAGVVLVLLLGAVDAQAVTRGQAERASKWHTMGLDLQGNGDTSGVRVLGCSKQPRSWLCQVEAPGESIVLNPDGTPMTGMWRFAFRITGRGCRVTLQDAEKDRYVYRACPSKPAA